MEGSTDKHKEMIKYLKDEIYVKRDLLKRSGLALHLDKN